MKHSLFWIALAAALSLATLSYQSDKLDAQQEQQLEKAHSSKSERLRVLASYQTYYQQFLGE